MTATDPPRRSVKRSGCVCEGHDHVPDSWFPDYCNTCSCRCKQTAPSQNDPERQ